MKNNKMMFSLLSLLAVALSGCDAPGGGRARSRLPASTNISSIANTGFSPTTTNTGTLTDPNATATPTPAPGTTEAGYASCDINYVRSSGSLGGVSICHSSVDETKIKVKFATTDQTDGTCFVPTHKNTDGTSIYVGVAQCTYHTTGQLLNGTLVKNRQGYSSASLNGVMIMKRSYLNDYFACMDAIPNFITNNCPTNTTNACYAQAQSFMGQVCQYFKSRGNYLDIAF